MTDVVGVINRLGHWCNVDRRLRCYRRFKHRSGDERNRLVDRFGHDSRSNIRCRWGCRRLLRSVALVSFMHLTRFMGSLRLMRFMHFTSFMGFMRFMLPMHFAMIMRYSVTTLINEFCDVIATYITSYLIAVTTVAIAATATATTARLIVATFACNTLDLRSELIHRFGARS